MLHFCKHKLPSSGAVNRCYFFILRQSLSVAGICFLVTRWQYRHKIKKAFAFKATQTNRQDRNPIDATQLQTLKYHSNRTFEKPVSKYAIHWQMYCILTLMRFCYLCTTTQLEAYFSKSVPNMHSSKKKKVDDFCGVDKIISTFHTCSIEVTCIQILLKVASSVISFVWHCSIDRRELSRRFITLTSGRLGLEKRFQILQRLKMLSAYAVSVSTSRMGKIFIFMS